MEIKILRDKGNPSHSQRTKVYGFYTMDNLLYFLVFPHKHFGLVAFNINEVEITDPLVGDKIVLTNKFSSNYDLFLHHSIVENELYVPLLEQDPSAYDQFMKSINKPIRNLYGLDLLNEMYVDFDRRYGSHKEFKKFVNSFNDILIINKALQIKLDKLKEEIHLAEFIDLNDQKNISKILQKDFIDSYVSLKK